MKNRYVYLILGVIIFVAFLLRFVKLEDVPPGLNRDEAAIGYTAYSLLKTGRDEHGVFLPLSLKSFGDWKLPVYIYATVPAVAVLGLTDVAVRLPSVIGGTLTILLVYLIALKLFEKPYFTLLSAAVMTISPWHIFFSRVASEANLAVLFVTAALYFFLASQKKHWYFLVGFLFLGLSLLTYHGNHVFTPLIFIAICVYFRKNLRNRAGFIGISIFILSALLIYRQTLFSADKTKISGLFSLNDPSLVYENIVKNRLIFSDSFLAKIFYNKASYFVEHVVQNYVNSFSPEFLFIRGGENQQHNIPDFGNLYLIEAPFLLLGLYFLFARKEKSAWLLLAWILIAPVGAALTKDAPHSARSYAVFPAISLIVAYGISGSVAKFPTAYKKLVVGGIIFLYLLNIPLFLPRYFVIFPYKRYAVWGKAYQELVTKLVSRKSDYKEVFVARPDYSPYIYYLFYHRSDPKAVQQNLVRYPPTSEGFEHVQSFDGIMYQKIGWADELLLPDRLYVDWVEGIPVGATQSAVMITKQELAQLYKSGRDTTEVSLGTWVKSRIVDEVRLPDGTPLLYFIETYVDQEGINKL